MHFFYIESNDCLVGTTFNQNEVKFNQKSNDLFIGENEFNLMNASSYNLNLKPGFNKFNEEQIQKIKEITNLDFEYEYASGVVVGRVLECDEHPDSDHMHVLKVDIGSEILDIVCGASNIAKDLYVAVAKPGIYMESIDLFIKPSKLRGVASYGMICSKYELGLIEEKVKGIWEISETTKLGKDVYTI